MNVTVIPTPGLEPEMFELQARRLYQLIHRCSIDKGILQTIIIMFYSLYNITLSYYTSHLTWIVFN